MKERTSKRHWSLAWFVAVACLLCYHSSNVHRWFRTSASLGQIYSSSGSSSSSISSSSSSSSSGSSSIKSSISSISSSIKSSISSSSSSISSINLEKIFSSNVSSSRDFENGQDINISAAVAVAVKTCATVEEMGTSSGGGTSTKDADIQIREMVQRYVLDHGAQRVRALEAEQFCKQGFVFGRPQEDGFGNEMYKVLTAAGLALLLNRSLIIGEQSSTNPAYLGLNGKVQRAFGDYLSYSDEAFTMREVKRLWVVHDCVGKHGRNLNMRTDSLLRAAGTVVFCEDWTTWASPIIWYFGAQDAVALQLFLKNVHPGMRSLAVKLLGDPLRASSRPNLFGELMRVFIKPMPVIEDAIQWTLKGGPDPDVALHLRMRNSRSRYAIEAACSCVRKSLRQAASQGNRLPRVVVVTDTPSVLSIIAANFEGSAEVVFFDYDEYVNSADGGSQALKQDLSQPPKKRLRDWGPLPRWVALVDFYLASRAKYGVVSGASKRVATTYAQLLAALAASHSLENERNFTFHSSFHSALLVRGLALQSGWGHTWRTFSGGRSCRNQSHQCALTPLLPHAWWDNNRWQVPTSKDVRSLRSFGVQLNATSGEVSQDGLASFCKFRRRHKATLLKLELPPRHKISSA